MSFVSYELAKAINDDRLSKALARAEFRRMKAQPTPPASKRQSQDADVIELAFGAHCEPTQIGA